MSLTQNIHTYSKSLLGGAYCYAFFQTITYETCKVIEPLIQNYYPSTEICKPLNKALLLPFTTLHSIRNILVYNPIYRGITRTISKTKQDINIFIRETTETIYKIGFDFFNDQKAPESPKENYNKV